MARPLALAAIAGIVLAHAGADLSACGDKFLLVGRSLRYRQAFAAAHPSEILAYAVPGSRLRELIKEQGFGALLTFAGHTVRVIDGNSDLRQVLSSSRVDLVLVDPRSASDVQSRLASASSHPLLVPVVFNLSKAASANVEQQYGCVIKMPARATEALAAIEQAIKLHDRQSR